MKKFVQNKYREGDGDEVRTERDYRKKRRKKLRNNVSLCALQ